MDSNTINIIYNINLYYNVFQLNIMKKRKRLLTVKDLLIDFMNYVQTKQAIHFIDKEDLAVEYLKR